jgi:CDP-diglyceride synthetase
VAEIHKFDFLFYITGIIGLSAFCFIVYAIAFLSIPEENKEVWIHLIGITEGVVLSIFGYYFGSAIKRNVQ